MGPGLYSERRARRKFELAQKINDNAKLVGGLVHYLRNLVAGEWVALKPPRREGSRKLTADYRRHLKAARQVLRVPPQKCFSPDGESCAYYPVLVLPILVAGRYNATNDRAALSSERQEYARHPLVCSGPEATNRASQL